jgi:F0F1-type ATP synthase membrane subunit b/b'
MPKPEITPGSPLADTLAALRDRTATVQSTLEQATEIVDRAHTALDQAQACLDKLGDYDSLINFALLLGAAENRIDNIAEELAPAMQATKHALDELDRVTTAPC